MYYKFSAPMEPLGSHMNFFKQNSMLNLCLIKFLFVSYIYLLALLPQATS